MGHCLSVFSGRRIFQSGLQDHLFHNPRPANRWEFLCPSSSWSIGLQARNLRLPSMLLVFQHPWPLRPENAFPRKRFRWTWTPQGNWQWRKCHGEPEHDRKTIHRVGSLCKVLQRRKTCHGEDDSLHYRIRFLQACPQTSGLQGFRLQDRVRPGSNFRPQVGSPPGRRYHCKDSLPGLKVFERDDPVPVGGWKALRSMTHRHGWKRRKHLLPGSWDEGFLNLEDQANPNQDGVLDWQYRFWLPSQADRKSRFLCIHWRCRKLSDRRYEVLMVPVRVWLFRWVHWRSPEIQMESMNIN